MSTDTIDELDQTRRAKSAQLTEPRPDECLACFVARMVTTHGCDHTLRWVARFRDQRSPRSTGLERRLEDMGGYCDCEVLLNCYSPVDSDVSCRGVERTSVRPCAAWGRPTWS